MISALIFLWACSEKSPSEPLTDIGEYESEELIIVEGDTYSRGDEIGDLWEGTRPVHQVTLSDFMISPNLITQAEWERYMPSENYTHGEGGRYPAYNVSWYSILKYCNLRSIYEGFTPVYSIAGSTDPADWGYVPETDNDSWTDVFSDWSAEGYRLPTDAEWEYAARGGKFHSDGFLYSGSNDPNDVAWYDGNSGSSGSSDYGAKPVGSKLSNQLGIYDMSGNLWEYCWDRWHTYQDEHLTDPRGPVSPGTSRVIRGGCWAHGVFNTRVAYRGMGFTLYTKYYFIGFRVVRSIIELSEEGDDL